MLICCHRWLSAWQPAGRRVITASKNPKKTDDNGWTVAEDARLYKWKGTCRRVVCFVRLVDPERRKCCMLCDLR